MPQAKEFIIQMEDTPGTLGRCCQALAQEGVNILAFQAYEREGQSLIRMVVDAPTSAKRALDAARFYYTLADVARANLPHRSSELSRIASRLAVGMSPYRKQQPMRRTFKLNLTTTVVRRSPVQDGCPCDSSPKQEELRVKVSEFVHL